MSKAAFAEGNFFHYFTDKQLAELKASWAREIFAEIEFEIVAALVSNYNAKYKIVTKGEVNSILYSIIEGKIAALRGIDDFIAHLKKKYESEGAE